MAERVSFAESPPSLCCAVQCSAGQGSKARGRKISQRARCHGYLVAARRRDGGTELGETLRLPVRQLVLGMDGKASSHSATVCAVGSLLGSGRVLR